MLFLQARNAQEIFHEKPEMKIKNLKKQKHEYLIHTWSEKTFKGKSGNAMPGDQSVIWNYVYSPFNTKK